MAERRCLWQTVYGVFTRPLFGTVTIPRDARVDPTHFDAEGYPVWCPDCGYLLRGLPDGSCPECGTAFDRGRLLVQQYVRLQLPKRHRARRWGRWLFWGGMTGLFAMPGILLALWILTQFGDAHLAMRFFEWKRARLLTAALGGCGVLAIGMFETSVFWEWAATRHLRRQRGAVLREARADVRRASAAAASATNK